MGNHVREKGWDESILRLPSYWMITFDVPRLVSDGGFEAQGTPDV